MASFVLAHAMYELVRLYGMLFLKNTPSPTFRMVRHKLQLYFHYGGFGTPGGLYFPSEPSCHISKPYTQTPKFTLVLIIAAMQAIVCELYGAAEDAGRVGVCPRPIVRRELLRCLVESAHCRVRGGGSDARHCDERSIICLLRTYMYCLHFDNSLVGVRIQGDHRVRPLTSEYTRHIWQCLLATLSA